MTPSWLLGRSALVIGEGQAVELVADALRDHGALVLKQTGLADQIALGEGDTAIDLLVHGGANLSVPAPDAASLDDWRASVSGDLDARFLQTADFARRCISRSEAGAVLFLLPSHLGGGGRVAQATVLGAAENLIKTLAVEWARDGIRVNGIASHACEPKGAADAEVRASLGHLSAYLLSDYAAYVSGAVMGLDET